MKRKLCFLVTVILTMMILAVPFTAAEEAEPVERSYERYEYEIDYHNVPELTAACLDPKVIDGARRVVDAFFAHETKVDLHGLSLGDVDYIGGVLYRMCPPVMALTDYDVNRNFNTRTGILKLNYMYDADETMELVRQFEASVDKYMSLLRKDDSEAMRALILYYAFTIDSTYDYAIYNDADSYTLQEQHYWEGSFSAIVNHTGICTGFSNGLAFLYNLAGISADMVQNPGNKNGAGSHAWVIARIDGGSYFIDPTWGIVDCDGYGSVYYFGMSAEDRFSMGGYALEDTTAWYKPISDSAELNSTRFEALHVPAFMYVTEFIPNHDDQTIYIAGTDCSVTFDASSR